MTDLDDLIRSRLDRTPSRRPNGDLADALRDVLDLHYPVMTSHRREKDQFRICDECERSESIVEYPCDTVCFIARALGIEVD